ncbi:MAG TPA: efflux RND transporter periplasmic adaptor subunit [Rhizomicrobium sp.]|nr:efflux RND transporter periplasmic adaptor subunit [Rhizomicrobium sp.]
MRSRASLLLLVLVLAGCGGKEDHAWLGYGEGDNVFISAPQPGWVAQMNVERGSEVRRGDTLFVLDDTEQEAARNQAAAQLPQVKAQMAQAQANLELTRKNLERQQGLAAAHAGVPAMLDQAVAAYRQAQDSLNQLEAQQSQAQAALSGAEYTLTQRAITSYVDGAVQDIYFRQGEYAPASTPVISVLPARNVFARFFVPETELAKVHLGQKVRITCDGCKPMEATVTFIAQQEEFTPPVIFSVGNREKLVYKLEARAPGGLKLHPGQPIEVRPVAAGPR